MEVFYTKLAIRDAVANARKSGLRIGLVPTMGALHQGHIRLVDALRDSCDFIALWIFVNPTQFNSRQDYESYPCSLEQDLKLAQQAGVDVVFAPTVEEIYPRGLHSYQEKESVRVYAGDRADNFEGASRVGHFDGVVHVVLCFLNIMQPDVVVLGEKDYQQVQVVRQMLQDLHLDVELLVAPIAREPGGRAFSSRNQLLDSRDASSFAIARGLMLAQDLVNAGERPVPVLVAQIEFEVRDAGLDIEYVAVVDPESLEPLEMMEADARVLIAARLGNVRLIDTTALTL